MNYEAILELMRAHRKEIGFAAAPCIRVRLKTGERFALARIVESNQSHFVALAYLEDETGDETPRFRFVAVAPDQISLVEAYEPEQRAADATRRFNFPMTKKPGQTTRVGGTAPG